MATPPNKCFLILFLVPFAMVATMAAIGTEASATAAAPSPANGVVLHPEAEYSIPDLPVPALLHCPPLFPKIPLIPCHEVPSPPRPEVRQCRPSLEKLMPCAGFLTDRRVFAPPAECCAALDPFYDEDAAALT
ncbi:hypothetical protein PVAP13_2KG221800 [Panicum virgatum]|jgi:hypothetical protein|uniref:Bifunctional inhibitor/plant lipid transfer protein/seed storage helical domain-containing protein n=1 Tax=Panicum virgatum TaxID=38727 RepID=A0A8T0VY17_PANVG|nr:hypothetical protein PVAP13_2KG221800 [Panicum virgatum]